MPPVEHVHLMDERRLVVRNAVRGRKRDGQVAAAVTSGCASARETRRPSWREWRPGRLDGNDRSLFPLHHLRFPFVAQLFKHTSHRYTADEEIVTPSNIRQYQRPDRVYPP